jgi:hypothetical protein
VYGSSSNGDGVAGVSTGGYGVLGESSSFPGVYAYSGSSDGVLTSSGSGDALYAYTYGAGDAVYAYGDSGYGVYAETSSGPTGIYGNNFGSGYGIKAHSTTGIGLYTSSDSWYALWAQSTNHYAVIGEDSGSGIGVYGSSGSGWAGYFAGPVSATSYTTSSDRNAKTNIQPIDRKDILDRVSQLPITSWDFKKDLKKHHVGPMAQDFHAAFGLDGEDDTHINLTDMAGVSLAAIQELSSQMKAKDAQIAELKKELSAQTKALEARMTVLEHQQGLTVQSVALRTQTGSEPGAAE